MAVYECNGDVTPTGKYLIVHAAIVMGFAPTFIGVKHNGVPLPFKAIHLGDSTGKARVFSCPMILGGCC